MLDVSFVLASQAPTQLNAMLAAIDDPHSPQYHHYLTPADFSRQFGAAPEVEARVEQVLGAAGLTITSAPASDLLLHARGSVSQIEALLGVQIENYQMADGTPFYSATSAPRLPVELRGAVTGVLGLDNRAVVKHPSNLRRPRANSPANTPQDNGFAPADLAAAYDLGPLTQAGLDGSTQSIAFGEIDTFKQSDIDAYDKAYGITASPVKVVQVGSGAETASGGSETTLDIEVAHAVAPKAQVIAYEGGATFQGLASTFNQMVTDNRAHIASISLGICEQYVLHPDTAPAGLSSSFDEPGPTFLTSLDNTFKQADAQGMSVFVSSGDNGAYDCGAFDPTNHTLSASVPADSPYVTAVGGTALFLSTSGSYGREAGWESPLEAAGSGGGVSMSYQRPSWQTGPGTDNQYSDGMREVPDVAANADPLTGYSIYDSSTGCTGNDCWTIVGGTSAASPFWAALISLADQALAAKHQVPLGLIDPMLYTLGRGSSAASVYHDVTLGGNLYYPATTGWDYSTGWGSPDGNAIDQALMNLAQPAG
jgi:kumamolisin